MTDLTKANEFPSIESNALCYPVPVVTNNSPLYHESRPNNPYWLVLEGTLSARDPARATQMTALEASEGVQRKGAVL